MKKLSIFILGLSGFMLFACSEDKSLIIPLFPSEDKVVGAQIFQGTYSELPGCDADTEGYLYYVTDPTGQFYYCGAGAYHSIDLTGPAGADGASMVWLGSSDNPPVICNVSNNLRAYYDSNDFTALICNGTASTWQTLAEDGADADHMTTSGTVASGSYLELVHNLNTSNLNVVGQFIKDGILYDYTEYADYFAPDIPETILSDNTKFETTAPTYVASTTLANGNILVAYRESDTGNNYGAYVIFRPSGSFAQTRAYFAPGCAASYIAVAPFKDGGALIAFRNESVSNQPYFQIIQPSGSVLDTDAFQLEAVAASFFSAASLSNGTVFIGYRDSNNSGRGRYAIVEPSAGTIVSSGTFNTSGTNSISISEITDNKLLLAYNSNAVGTFKITTNNPNTILAGPFTFHDSNTMDISAVGLPNGYACIAYRNMNTGCGEAAFYDLSGTLIRSNVFQTGSTYLKHNSAVRLPSGDVFIGYRNLTSVHGEAVIFNQYGYQLSTPVEFGSATADYCSPAPLGNGNVFIFWDSNSVGGIYTVFTRQHLQLCQVDTNTVRFKNNTEESLDLILSVLY